MDSEVLHKIELVAQAVISEEVAKATFLEGVELDVFWDGKFRQLVAMLCARVYSKKLWSIVYSHPEDWWQAFKERWFPAWALRRWPARRKFLRADMRALFPDVPLAGKYEPYTYLDHEGGWDVAEETWR